MKFRFLGDVDCPDWLLAEIYNLSQMSSPKIKTLALIVIRAIIDGKIDDEKMKKISQEFKTETESLKALIAALDMIFTTSTRNSASSADLNSELQQLGLPREHSNIISRLYSDNSAQITTILTSQSLRINKFSSVKIVPSEKSPLINMVLKTINNPGDKEKETSIHIPKDKLTELLTELKTVRSLMEQVL